MRFCVVFVLASAIAVNAFAQMPACFSGTVRYLSGKPAAGVHVTFNPGIYFGEDFEGSPRAHEAITDKRGRFEIIRPEGGFIYNGPAVLTNCILARDLEHNLAAVQSVPNDGKITNVDLTLNPGMVLSGSIQDPEGAPVSGAEIELEFMGAGPMRPPFKANATGQYRIRALPRGIRYAVSISAKGYGRAWAEEKATNTQVVRYEFPTVALKHADRKLAGRVVDYDGMPLPGTWVTMGGAGQPMNLGFDIHTDKEGRFSSDGVCEGQLGISGLYTDPAGRNIQMIPEHVKAGDTNILIQLPYRISAWDGPALKGTVSDPKDNPDTNVVFSVWNSANPFVNFYSDSKGKYEVHWRPPVARSDTRSVLIGRDSQRNLSVMQEIDASTTNLDLVMQPGLSVAGVVLDENGTAVTNVCVLLNMDLESSNTLLTRTVTDNHGSFSFAGLPRKGEYSLGVATEYSDSDGIRISSSDTNLVLKINSHPKDYFPDRLPVQSNH